MSKIYGLRIKWEYSITPREGFDYELLPNIHLRGIKNTLLTHHDDPSKNDEILNVLALLKAIIYNGLNFYNIEKEPIVSIDLGRTNKIHFSFPNQIVIISKDLSLPEKFSLSGNIITNISDQSDRGVSLVKYSSMFNKFKLQRIDSNKAKEFLDVCPNDILKTHLTSHFKKVHDLLTITSTNESSEESSE
ncbi:putative matrix protein [rudbeckia virus 1]|uniref:Matrix protein n=1 Tax=rudbeckia virus 1 TaxID=2971904 RepID=A0AAX3C930_9RHAB|nr:putative matrix protein [rudbeckia virus 1]